MQVLRIPRTSDSKAFSMRVSWKSAASGAQGEPMHEASELMGAVHHLLRSLCKSPGDEGTVAVGSDWSFPFKAVLSRHPQLSIQFKPPKAASYDIKNVYAVWGAAAADPAAPRSLYVCGEPDDYAPELEDLLAAAVVPAPHRKQPATVRSANSSACLVQKFPMRYRALRLLYFLEDPVRFLKHFERSFHGLHHSHCRYFCRALMFCTPADSAVSRCHRCSSAASSAPPEMLNVFWPLCYRMTQPQLQRRFQQVRAN
jgi:hypothetical protein